MNLTRYAVVITGLTLIFAAAGSSLRSMIAQQGYRFNSTASLPVGVYKTVAASNLVSFCPPAPYATLSIERGYGERSPSSTCLAEATPFLKGIVAIAGDHVSLSAQGVTVNGKMLRNSAPLRIDSHGRSLPGFPFGEYVVQLGQVWVINEHSAKSLDSRYYGPIRTSEIREYLRPVVVLQ